MKLKCLQIDLARQKENFDFIKSYIDFAAGNGYNTLVIYLENAVRTEATCFFDEKESYSKKEMSEIVSYAESKGLDVVPAFENLAHLEKFFRYVQLEKFSECEDEQKEGRGFDGDKRGSCGCVSNLALREFADAYIKEVCEVFHSEYVHMGLDEPFDFADCGRCKEKMAAENKTKADLFFEHVIHSYELVKSMGKRMMMWDDFFEYADIVERLPRDIIFCNWNYAFVSEEPSGHWTNRIKRDWFKYYDELGFEYLFCVYGHRASSVYNLETFTNYAKKHNPLGGLVAEWERSDSFYFGSYPFVAYAGRKWSDKSVSEEDRLKVYSELLGSDEAAELVLSLNVPSFYGGYNDVAVFCENDYFVKYSFKDKLEYATKRLCEYKNSAKGLAKTILTDIYDYCYFMLLSLRLQRLGTEIFDNYETKKIAPSYFINRLKEISLGYDEIEKNSEALWNEYRRGIVSYNCSVFRKYENVRKTVQKVIDDVKKDDEVGILYADLMLHDGFCTVKAEISVKYSGDEGEKTLYVGSIKPSATGFELGGGYGFRIATENKEIEYLRFVVFGEGALYPLNFRYLSHGKKYIAVRVEKVCGKAEELENILHNDTRFAVLGYDDGIEHFNRIELSKKRSEIKVYFKSLSGDKSENKCFERK